MQVDEKIVAGGHWAGFGYWELRDLLKSQVTSHGAQNTPVKGGMSLNGKAWGKKTEWLQSALRPAGQNAQKLVEMI